MIARRALALTLLAPSALSLAACAAATQAPDEVGYVLLDAEARTAGRISHGSFTGAPLLPVALEVAEPAVFSSNLGRTEIALEPGMLAWVHGAAGAVEWRALGGEVSRDTLRVRGTRGAAADLAQRLAGRLEGGGDGVWTVVAPDVLDRASFLAPPDGLLEISPEPALGLAPVANPFEGPVLTGGASPFREGPAPAGGAPRGPAGEPLDARSQARWVGLYADGGCVLLLDAAGGFTLEGWGDQMGCDHPDAGRWHADGDRVALRGTHDGGTMVLAFDPASDALVTPDGAHFSLALLHTAIGPFPKEGQP